MEAGVEASPWVVAGGVVWTARGPVGEGTEGVSPSPQAAMATSPTSGAGCRSLSNSLRDTHGKSHTVTSRRRPYRTMQILSSGVYLRRVATPPQRNEGPGLVAPLICSLSATLYERLYAHAPELVLP